MVLSNIWALLELIMLTKRQQKAKTVGWNDNEDKPFLAWKANYGFPVDNRIICYDYAIRL